MGCGLIEWIEWVLYRFYVFLPLPVLRYICFNRHD